MQKMLVLLILSQLLYGCGGTTDVVKGVTAKKIESIKRGMPMDSVIAILGRPYIISASSTYHTNCSYCGETVTDSTDIKKALNKWKKDTTYCCSLFWDAEENLGITFTYTRPVADTWWYPMLWVHFNSDLTVSSLLAKRYYLFFDDEPIYTIDGDLTVHWLAKKTFYDSFPE